jgi:hypothetical protein
MLLEHVGIVRASAIATAIIFAPLIGSARSQDPKTKVLNDPLVKNSCFRIAAIRPSTARPKPPLPGVILKSGSTEIVQSRFGSYGYKVVDSDSVFGLPGGAGESSVYSFVGRSSVAMPDDSKFVFQGVVSNPITFVLSEEHGLVYLEGEGSVTLSDGTVTQLPCKP